MAFRLFKKVSMHYLRNKLPLCKFQKLTLSIEIQTSMSLTKDVSNIFTKTVLFLRDMMTMFYIIKLLFLRTR